MKERGEGGEGLGRGLVAGVKAGPREKRKKVWVGVLLLLRGAEGVEEMLREKEEREEEGRKPGPRARRERKRKERRKVEG